ncbi:hypothetical protein C6Q14_18075 [Burkholderia ambifaria]|nr:hypothetical protein C6Q14_18075 [Burkholderia ambifaria]
MALAQDGTPLAQNFRTSVRNATRAGRSAEWSHAIEVPYDQGCSLPMWALVRRRRHDAPSVRD